MCERLLSEGNVLMSVACITFLKLQNTYVLQVTKGEFIFKIMKSSVCYLFITNGHRMRHKKEVNNP